MQAKFHMKNEKKNASDQKWQLIGWQCIEIVSSTLTAIEKKLSSQIMPGYILELWRNMDRCCENRAIPLP